MTSLTKLLIWNTVINYAILFVWLGAFVYAHGWMYRLPTRWFKLSVETFDALHYAGMSVYKICILMFNLVPLVVIWLVT
jgi:Family of unknown function (DUF6868)